jgi:DDE family transposase
MDNPLKYFSELRDPRVERNREHLLEEILLIAIAAVLSGAESWNDIADYGEAKREWLKTFLTLPSGIPSHDTWVVDFGRSITPTPPPRPLLPPLPVTRQRVGFQPTAGARRAHLAEESPLAQEMCAVARPEATGTQLAQSGPARGRPALLVTNRRLRWLIGGGAWTRTTDLRIMRPSL